MMACLCSCLRDNSDKQYTVPSSNIEEGVVQQNKEKTAPSNGNTTSDPSKTRNHDKENQAVPLTNKSLMFSPDLQNERDIPSVGSNVIDEPEFISAFRALISGPVQKFLDDSDYISSVVKDQAGLIKEAFEEELKFLHVVATPRPKVPDDVKLREALQQLSTKINAVVSLRDANRKSVLFNHLSVISESVPALGWVSLNGKPNVFVEQCIESLMFYGNKVIVEYKQKDPKHLDWVKSWKNVMEQMRDYTKEFHPSGVIWNIKPGVPEPSLVPSGSSVPAPPSLPPPPPPSNDGDTSGDSTQDRSAMFSQLNVGADITKGLKKVTNEMKTHKNPALRQGGSVPAKKEVSSNPTPAPKTVVGPAKIQTPVLELDGKKWRVEHHVGNKTLKITDCNMKQTVYIYKCTDSLIQVSAKVNSVILDGCKKTAVVVHDILAGIEFVNCQSAQCQINGSVKTISIDKTDGCMIYLSKDSVDAEIVTAKSSELNILVPKPDGDFSEHALPEQFKSVWNGKDFITNATDINK